MSTTTAATSSSSSSSSSPAYADYATGAAGDVSLGLRRRPLHWGEEAPEVVYHSSDDSTQGADSLLVIFPAARLGIWIATNTAEPWTREGGGATTGTGFGNGFGNNVVSNRSTSTNTSSVSNGSGGGGGVNGDRGRASAAASSRDMSIRNGSSGGGTNYLPLLSDNGGDFGEWVTGTPTMKVRGGASFGQSESGGGGVGQSRGSPRFCEAVLAHFVDTFFPPPRLPARAELSFDLWTQLLPPLSADPLVDLFVIPSSGGSAPVAFEQWPSLLPDFVQVRGVLLPGRASRVKDPPMADAVEMAHEIAGAVCTAVTRRGGSGAGASAKNAPWALFGHGLGALLAYEVARVVEARTGRAPVHMFVSGCASPTTAVNGRGIARWVSSSDASERAAAVTTRGGLTGTGTGDVCGTSAAEAAIADIHAAAAAAMKVANYPDSELVDVLSRSSRLPRNFRRSTLMLRAMISTLRADITAEETYEWRANISGDRDDDIDATLAHALSLTISATGGGSGGGSGFGSGGTSTTTMTALSSSSSSSFSSGAANKNPATTGRVSCPVTVFAGTDDEETLDEDLACWRDVTSSACTVHRLPGDHYYLEDTRGREVLTKAINAALSRHMTRHTSWLGIF